VGPASLVVVANTSSPAAGCAAGTPCGLLPAGVIVQVAGGVATGGNVVLTSKLAPVTGPSSGAGAFGYVMNFQGVGIGGYTITATAAGAPTVTAVSATQTGLWTMSGLAANTTYTFTLNGPGVVDSNVRPAQSVTARTAAAGRWVDPSFVITAPGVGPLPLPGLGGRVVLALQNDGAGPSLSWTLPASGTPSYLVARLSARGVTVLPTSGIPLPSTTTNFADSSTPGVPVQCYTVLLVDGSPPALQGNSDVLCTSAGVRSASGAPEGFTIRLSTASTVSLIWAPPQTGGLDGYRLVPLGGMPLDLASSVLSQDQSISGPACFALLAMAHGAAIGNTELLCAVPGLANPPQ
jgi:hypothetical protein